MSHVVCTVGFPVNLNPVIVSSYSTSPPGDEAFAAYVHRVVYSLYHSQGILIIHGREEFTVSMGKKKGRYIFVHKEFVIGKFDIGH